MQEQIMVEIVNIHRKFILSSENCSVNNLINFKHPRAKIYNRDFPLLFLKKKRLIVSEDTFHQVNDKENFNEINRVLSVNGHIIMSDIFLLEECMIRKEKKQRNLRLSHILKQSEFIKHAVNYNIELMCFFINKRIISIY